MIILILGIVFSGSRGVAVLGILTLVIICVWKCDWKKIALIVFSITASVAIGIVILNLDISRLLKLTLDSSTLNGRFLYWQDALPLLLKYPLGLGYMGYYFLQPQIQSGNYVTKFVHNDILQIGLDAGIISVIIILAIVVKALISKKIEVRQKLILLVLFFHSLFDFDLQFTLMAFIGIMCISESSESDILIGKKSKKFFMSVLAITGGISLYFVAAFELAYVGEYDFSLKLYPYNTFAREERMRQKTNDLLDAEYIIEQNGMLPDAYEVRIQNSCENGDTDKITEDVEQLLNNAGYNAEYYNQAVYYLSIALDYSIRSNDMENARETLKTLQAIPDKIEEMHNKTSRLAYKINDKPEIKLETSIENYLDKISNVTLE